MSTYIEQALVVVDNEYETRLTFEPGYTDDRDRECVRVLVGVKDAKGELRIPYSEVMVLAKRLIELAQGRPVKLTIRKARNT